MKIGRPDCYIPSPETVLRDVKKVFVGTCGMIARMLQVSLEDKGVHITYLLTALMVEFQRQTQLCY